MSTVLSTDIVDISFDEITTDIKHPNYPKIIVTVAHLSDLEKMEYFSEMQKYTTPVVLTDPHTGEILIQDDPVTGRPKPVVHEQTNIPVQAMTGLLKKSLRKVSGLTTKGVPMSLEQAIKAFYEKKLDVKEEGKEDQGFWSYLNAKIMDEATFFADPTVNS